MKRVVLHGLLGKRFGREFVLDVQSVAEAMSALVHMLPGFADFMRQSESMGICWRVQSSKDRVYSAEELTMNLAGDVLELRPIVIGSKRAGALQTIVGVVLIVVGAVLTYTGIGAGFGQYAIKVGVALLLGGVIQMISAPKGLAQSESEEKARSYLFNGAAGTMRQGGPVPLGYGRMLIGPQVISAGMNLGLYEEPPITDPSDPDYVPPGAKEPGGILMR